MPAKNILPTLALAIAFPFGNALAEPVGIDWEVVHRFRMLAKNEVNRYRQDLQVITSDLTHQKTKYPSPTTETYDTTWNPYSHSYQKDYPLDRKREILLTPRLPKGLQQKNLLCQWWVDGKPDPGTIESCDPKTITVTLNEEGRGHMPVKLVVMDQNRVTLGSDQKILTPRDLVIVALGDSFGSGEGVPDVNAYVVANESYWVEEQWLDRRCHRSMFSGFNQAAFILSEDDKEISVTMLNFTCSGAEIRTIEEGNVQGGEHKDGGLLTPFAGVDRPDKKHPLKPQLEDAIAALCPQDRYNAEQRECASLRKPDLVLISIGGNDVGFGPVLKNLIAKPHDHDCEKELINKAGPNVSWKDYRVNDKMELLENNFVLLRSAIRTRLQPTSVLISEYPDPTHDQTGEKFCNSSIFNRAGRFSIIGHGNLSDKEYQCAFKHILQPLNRTIERMVSDGNAEEARSTRKEKINWIYNAGMMEATRHGGICAKGPEGEFLSYFNWLDASEAVELEFTGTVHPNIFGYMAYRKILLPRMENEVKRIKGLSNH
ncbi:MAG: hypothetical protein HQL95_00050 [Magnetococcales bacterium]|nr:hypothetical protein [Magnetococcales bacterium]